MITKGIELLCFTVFTFAITFRIWSQRIVYCKPY